VDDWSYIVFTDDTNSLKELESRISSLPSRKRFEVGDFLRQARMLKVPFPYAADCVHFDLPLDIMQAGFEAGLSPSDLRSLASQPGVNPVWIQGASERGCLTLPQFIEDLATGLRGH
jgi:hypothetical protein